MTVVHERSKRKPTGGLLVDNRKARIYSKGRDYLSARIGETKVKTKRTKGGSEKRIMLSAEYANVVKDGKAQKTKILSVIENKANPNFVRMNVVTKNAIVKTELGNAVVTSRPGQVGCVNAKLIG